MNYTLIKQLSAKCRGIGKSIELNIASKQKKNTQKGKEQFHQTTKEKKSKNTSCKKPMG